MNKEHVVTLGFFGYYALVKTTTSVVRNVAWSLLGLVDIRDLRVQRAYLIILYSAACFTLYLLQGFAPKGETFHLSPGL